jgi:probable O-glycosylation ligase (exosortase A-associated)
MLEDNNDFALALVMNIPLLWYLGGEESKKWIRNACVIATFLTMVTVMLTHSRGGFLAMTMTLIWILWRSGKILQASLSLSVMAMGFLALAPSHVIDRVFSIGAGRADSSVAARLDSWAVALRMVGDNPLWGVGLRNFVDNAVKYGARSDTSTNVHVAHNSFLQIAAEGGGLAFVVYITLLLSVFWSCLWLRRVGRLRPDLAWARSYGSMFEAINFGFIVGGFFLNRGHFDLIYHFVALVGCTVLIARRALRTAPETVRSGGRGGVVRVQWRSGGASPALARWERTR